MMLKKLLIVCALLLFSASSAFAAETIQITVDGKNVVFEQQPVLQDDRTLVPLRAIFEALNAHVKWIEDSQTAVAEKRSNYISIQIGNKEMYKNGSPIPLEVPAQLINGRTMVPLRAVAEALDATVEWNNATNTITIQSKQEPHMIKDQYLEWNLTHPDSNILLATATCAYPAIPNPNNSEGIRKINETYAKAAQTYINQLKTSVPEIVGEDYAMRQESGYPFHPYEYTHTFDITYDKNNMMSIVELTSEYTGGAHPNSSKVSTTYDLTTGQVLGLTDILEGTQEELNTVIINGFTQLIKANPEMYFEDASSTLAEDISTANFYLTKDGIIFYFQPYAIAPYATGYPSYTLPFTGNEKLFKTL